MIWTAETILMWTKINEFSTLTRVSIRVAGINNEIPVVKAYKAGSELWIRIEKCLRYTFYLFLQDGFNLET